MHNTIYVSGHKNPDSDSICAAIAYAELKNRMALGKTYVPIRLGEVSRETQYILDYFDVEAPNLVKTVRPQIKDLDIDQITPISPEISLQQAWSIMKKYEVKNLPVVDENSKLLGLASVSNLTTNYMDIWDNNIIGKSNTTLENIVNTLSAKIIYENKATKKFAGKIVVGAMTPESAEEHIEENDIVICGNRTDTQNVAVSSKASLLIITGNLPIEEEIIEKAKASGTTIISTPHDTFTASRIIVQSIPIDYVMAKDDIVFFRNNEFVEDVKEIMLQTRYRSYPVLDENDRVIGSISRFHLISQNKKNVILVDHNERTQAVDGIEEAEILEIIDHHRVANIETSKPIYYRCEPVGSTSTIVANLYFENGIRPSRKIAGLLCGALISDTLLLKSPTTTLTDKHTLMKLAEIANIDIEEFAMDMFKAGTSLQGKTLEEIFYQDCKTFEMNGRKIAVAQVNTMDIEGFESMKADMLNLMNTTADRDGFDLILLLLTDIIKEGSLLLAVGKDTEIVNTAFGVKLENSCAYKEGVVSRKKQVIPPLTAAIEQLK